MQQNASATKPAETLATISADSRFQTDEWLLQQRDSVLEPVLGSR